MPVTVLFVPGLREHVEEHWQTHAARAFAGARTVPALAADRLSLKARVAALDAALVEIEGEVVLAAHSAGCLMVATWALRPTRAIKAALLATPADVEKSLPEGYPTLGELTSHGWVPVARAPLPFPAKVAASRNDPLAEYERVASFARSWGAELVDAGAVGHLNPAAGFGRWRAGEAMIARLSA